MINIYLRECVVSLKKLFPGFYSPSEQEFEHIKDECTFIFDTNVLLNLFRYPDKPREMLLKIFKGISNNIWIPYQVGMEYHYNVIDEIVSQNKAYDSLIRSLNDKYEKMREDFEKYAQRHTNLQMDEDLLDEVKKSLDKLISDLQDQKSQHPNLFNLQNELSSIIGDKVGKPFTEDELKALYEICDKRYEMRIPPGFKDVNKGDEKRVHNSIEYTNKYGDFILWRQILNYFSENKYKSVIFITDDTKSDWFKSFKGIKKPHPELLQEFRKECEESTLYIYTTKEFLKYASNLTGLKLEQEEIDEVVKGIDDYKKKKDSIEYEEEIENITVEEIIEDIPSYKSLNDKQKKTFKKMFLAAENEKSRNEVIAWAESQYLMNLFGNENSLKKYNNLEDYSKSTYVNDNNYIDNYSQRDNDGNSIFDYITNIVGNDDEIFKRKKDEREKLDTLNNLRRSIYEGAEMLPPADESYFLQKLTQLKNDDDIDLSLAKHKKLMKQLRQEIMQ
ncbi:PIN-like domain-containing protein [Peribacillus frigoritolerans]|uniref:PIN-like domain-containing protein n=1 Tax=Peribacillus frigoritolerans TaxID=450367 RepID=UPI00228087C3|nr:PIN-like domain-containing protein [Peribacillus frigoritolerans]MCY9003291.1 PIN-like domain-containing protein [Peribacillus frigoritolerans]